jgi:hypothetical protein
MRFVGEERDQRGLQQGAAFLAPSAGRLTIK